MNVIDEYTRECLTIKVKEKLNSIDVIDLLTDLFIMFGAPSFVRSDNGPEFIDEAVRDWLSVVGAKTAYIAISNHALDGRTDIVRATIPICVISY